MSAPKKLHFLSVNNTFLLLLLLFSVLIPGRGFAVSVITGTKGYSSGQLSKITSEKTFNTTFVGEILLGNGSLTITSLGNQPNNLVTNPSRFCFEDDRYEELENLIGSDVVLEYKTPKKNTLLSCSALHELVEIYPVTEHHSFDQTQLVGNVRTSDRETSHSIEFGRITNAIQTRNFNSRYFMTLQVGTRGSQFRHFVIDDQDLFDFAIEILKTAKEVKVHYSNRYSSRAIYGYHVRSFVTEIEIIE